MVRYAEVIKEFVIVGRFFGWDHLVIPADLFSGNGSAGVLSQRSEGSRIAADESYTRTPTRAKQL